VSETYISPIVWCLDTQLKQHVRLGRVMMFNLASRATAISSQIMRRFLPSPREAVVGRYFNGARKPSISSSDVVLVQCVEDLYYFGVFGQIISSLRERRSIQVEQFVLRSFQVGESRSLMVFLAYRLFNRLLGSKWVRLYSSFCDGVGYRSTGIQSPIGDVIDLCRAFASWRCLTTKDALISLVIDDVPVGDLVNDTFLRFKPAPTVNLVDFYLWFVIWQAYRDVRRARKYFARVRPKLYLTSYSTYIQHGIAVRVALQAGVKVFSFGNYQEFVKELSVNDWFHTKNPDSYADGFSKLENPQQKLLEAESALTARLSGTIDTAFGYMRKSAYAASDEPVPAVLGAFVIFLHDFYDSPHIYRDMVFPDFWKWICFTIEILEKSNARFFIKPHPNQVDLSKGVLSELKCRYPNLAIMSSNVTNKQLVDAGMACAVTVYGTVAHETAYMGVPTIACAHHPYINFGFCQTAKTKTEYADLLINHAGIKFDKPKMRRESLAFHYMHNLNLSAEEKLLMNAVAKFRSGCSRPEVGGHELVELLETISTLDAFEKSVTRIGFNSDMQLL